MRKKIIAGLFAVCAVSSLALMGGCGQGESLPEPRALEGEPVPGNSVPAAMSGETIQGESSPEGATQEESVPETGTPKSGNGGNRTGADIPREGSEGMGEGVLPETDSEAVRAYLSQFPEHFEEYEGRDDCFVMVHGKEHWGRDKWDGFLEDTARGTPSCITLVQFTVEGDPVLDYLAYDGQRYFHVSDASRDGFGNPENAFFEETRSCLKDFLYHDRSGDEYRYVLLTDSPELTMTEIEWYWYVGQYTDCADAVPDATPLFMLLESERERDAPKAEPGESFNRKVNTLEGLTAKLLYCTPVSLGIKITNESGRELLYGEAYDLQILQEGDWRSLSYLIDDAAFREVGFNLGKGESVIWGTDWTLFHGVLETGNYRIVKTVTGGGEGLNHGEHYLAVEFDIPCGLPLYGE